MRRKTGKEMRSLILAVSISTLLLVIAIIAYFMVSIIITTNDNIEHNKEKIIEESVRTLNEVSEMATMSNVDANILQLLNMDMVNQIISGESQSFYEVAVQMAIAFYPVDYVSVIHDGEVVHYGNRDDLVENPEGLPTKPPEKGYITLDALGNEEGFFISVFTPIDLALLGMEGELYLNMIVDRTEELADIEEYFNDQRNDLILQLSIAAVIAIILTLLLTTLGLRYFTNKYVVRPIEELNRAAEEIADGTFDGDLEVDEDSAYAALQGLLRSGQKVLKKMDEEMRE